MKVINDIPVGTTAHAKGGRWDWDNTASLHQTTVVPEVFITIV